MKIFWTTNLDGRQSIANFRKRRTLKKKNMDAKIIEYMYIYPRSSLSNLPVMKGAVKGCLCD